jgi:2'-hydroxyisoflavone reductase
LVESALDRGHTVTLFNRGQHNADLFPSVEKLRGNRDGELDVLRGRRWDAVIDTCGYFPRIVRASAEMLAHAVDHYTFISTVSVYAEVKQPSIDENAPLATIEDESVEKITEASYGALKALCEQAVERALPGRALVIRPGLIVGPHDPTDRFTYWPHRVARGGEVLAPGKATSRVQFIDVRDLAEWTMSMVEAKQTGVYNATGPAHALTMEQTLSECRKVSQSDARLTWVDEKFLLDAGVGAWIEMPLWVPEKEDALGFMQINCAQAIAAGMKFRPLSDTIRATLAWDATRSPTIEWRAGITPEREVELLEAWHQRRV